MPYLNCFLLGIIKVILIIQFYGMNLNAEEVNCGMSNCTLNCLSVAGGCGGSTINCLGDAKCFINLYAGSDDTVIKCLDSAICAITVFVPLKNVSFLTFGNASASILNGFGALCSNCVISPGIPCVNCLFNTYYSLSPSSSTSKTPSRSTSTSLSPSSSTSKTPSRSTSTSPSPSSSTSKTPSRSTSTSLSPSSSTSKIPSRSTSTSLTPSASLASTLNLSNFTFTCPPPQNVEFKSWYCINNVLYINSSLDSTTFPFLSNTTVYILPIPVVVYGNISLTSSPVSLIFQASPSSYGSLSGSSYTSISLSSTVLEFSTQNSTTNNSNFTFTLIQSKNELTLFSFGNITFILNPESDSNSNSNCITSSENHATKYNLAVTLITAQGTQCNPDTTTTSTTTSTTDNHTDRTAPSNSQRIVVIVVVVVVLATVLGIVTLCGGAMLVLGAAIFVNRKQRKRGSIVF